MAVGMGGPVLCALTRFVHVPMAPAIRPVFLVLWMICVAGAGVSILRERLRSQWNLVWLMPAMWILFFAMDILMVGCTSGFQTIMTEYDRHFVYLILISSMGGSLASLLLPRQTADQGPRQFYRCAKCGYDIHASLPSGRCPECGHLFEVGKDIPYLPKHLRAMENLQSRKTPNDKNAPAV